MRLLIAASLLALVASPVCAQTTAPAPKPKAGVSSVNQSDGIVACNVETVTTTGGTTTVTGVSKTCDSVSVTSTNQSGGVTAGYVGSVNQTTTASKPKSTPKQ